MKIEAFAREHEIARNKHFVKLRLLALVKHYLNKKYLAYYRKITAIDSHKRD